MAQSSGDLEQLTQLQQAVEERDRIIRRLTEQLVLVARSSIDDMGLVVTGRGASLDASANKAEPPRKIGGDQMPPGLFRRRTMSFLLDNEDAAPIATSRIESSEKQTIPYRDLLRHPMVDKHHLERYLDEEDCIQHLGIPRDWLAFLPPADLADRKWRASLSAFHYDLASKASLYHVSSPKFQSFENKDEK